MVKKVCFFGILALLLAGCAAPPAETISDIYVEQVPAVAQQIMVDLPEEAAQPVMEREGGEKLYLCGSYEVRVQTLRSGDLNSVLEEVTGYGKDRITLIETAAGPNRRYDCSWCSAGSEGELVARTAIIDDGNYCYCVTAMASSEDAKDLKQQWQQIFSTLELCQY